jgi:hypothetical protein
MKMELDSKLSKDSSAKASRSKFSLSFIVELFMRKTDSDKRIALFGSDPLKN